MPLPAVGFATFTAKAAGADDVVAAAEQSNDGDQLVVENDMYSLTFDTETGFVSQLTNKKSGASTSLNISWGWYNSSIGGCTERPADVPADIFDKPCSGQSSGAYMFRPNTSTVYYPGKTQKPTIQVVKGEVVTEVYQTFSSWATHVIRLYKNKNYVELEWTAGPIPVDTPWMPPVAFDSSKKPLDNNWGKEVIVKYASGLKSNGVFYTDSNGKEMVKRVYNKRPATYPQPYNISEPVAGNYYPVNALMSLDDGSHELAVLTDVSQGGASLADGELEFMVHRRVQKDDSRGVQEPLNETMCGCNDIGAAPGSMGAHGHEGDGGCECAGLTMRGKHWIVFDTIANAHEARRTLSEGINFPATLAFASQAAHPSFSAISATLPPNVKLVTLTNNYADHNDGQWLLRLSHLYQANEHPSLAQPVTFNLEDVFSKAGLKITGATETTLTANQPLNEFEARKHRWVTRAANTDVEKQMQEIASDAFETRVAFSYPKVTIRPMEVRTFLATFN